MTQINKDTLNDDKINKTTRSTTKDKLEIFLNGDYEYVDDFTKEMHIKRYEFNKYLHDISKSGKYQDFIVLLKEKINELDNKKQNEIKEILDEKYELKNGIPTENGTIREFDYIDFFAGNKFSVDDLTMAISKLYTGEKYTFYRRFLDGNCKTLNLRRNTSLKPYRKEEIEQLKNTVFVCNAKFDENNRPIPNTGITIRKEEVTEIINFLEENNIPIMPATFKNAKKRYLENTLEMNIEKQKTRTRK